jgi:NTE family protein
MSHFKLGRLALISCIALTLDAMAQEVDSRPVASAELRPTIGLALSGGGARGGAHVGVLRALEELGVPVDVIAGTSIGAIIGGLYASGMSVDKIEQVIDTIDWDAAFLGDTPRELKSFRRKRDDDLFLVDQRPGLNNGRLELPLGIVQGQVIDQILTEQMLLVADIRDFDELPIPFRAVATDITTGDAVVLGSGSLPAAIRASMSVPAVLAPIDIDGRLLVDGGVAMNLPIEVARQMGADVIIAVDISAPMSTREELTSVLAITGQLTNILMRRGVEAQLENLGPDDLLIVPEFGAEYGSASFARMTETIAFGYDATMGHAQTLQAHAVDVEETLAEQPMLAGPPQFERPIIEFLRLRNNSNISDALIERHLRGIEVGQPLDLATVEEAVQKIYGMELYQNVRYELITDGEQTGLEFQLDERSWGPNYLQMGLSLSASGDEDVIFGVAASYLRTRINELNGEWRATVAIGDEPGLVTGLHQPLGREGLFFVAPSFSLESNVVNVFDNGERLAQLQLRETTLEVAAGRELAYWGEVRAGLRRATGDIKLEVGDPGVVPAENFDEGEFFARFAVDTLDDLAFPRSGTIARIEWRGSRPDALGADVKFDQVSLAATYAKTWDRYTLLTRFRYDATTSGVAPVNGLNRLGGFLDLSGFNRNELSGQHAARIGTVFYRRINDFAFLPAFAGVSLEFGNVWDSRSDISARSSILGGSVWIGVDTPVGPVYAAYGRAEDDVSAFYVFLGRLF